MEPEKSNASSAASSSPDLTSLLESNAGTAIAERPGMGRVVVATRPMTITGTKLIREKPAVVWTGTDWPEFLRKFQSCSKRLQRAILDMFHPPLTSKDMLPFRLPAEQLARYHILDDADLIHKLIAIIQTNGHQYYGRPSVAYSEYFGLPGTEVTKLDALFVYGSKVAHSCAPSTAYTSKTQDGCLEYKLIRPIAEGDLVTFSYLDKLFVTPTHLRREKLLLSKSFICKCQRCVGPDFCRLLHCPTTGCEEFMACTNLGDASSNTTWTCPSCGDIDEESVSGQTAKEDTIERELKSLKMQAMFGLSRGSISTVKALVAKASGQLSPVHYLTLMATEHWCTVCASLAAQSEQIAMMGLSPPIGTEGLRLQAAECGFAFVSACECVAAGCNGKHCQVDDVENHEPLYECTRELFHACQDLIHVPQRRWPRYAAPMVTRYVPYMRICYGENDTDVADIERQVASKAVAAPSSGTLARQSAEPAPKQKATGTTTGKKNRKKKRGKKK